MQPFLFEREKKLLSLLVALKTPVGLTDFQKLLFLYCQELQELRKSPSISSSYDFVPYKFGAFSFTSCHDKTRLQAKGLIKESSAVWSLTSLGYEVGSLLANADAANFARRYARIRGDRLIAETYRQFPFTASRSEICPRVLRGDPTTRRRIKDSIHSEPNTLLLTIGYQRRSLECYINLLIQNGVHVLYDVRHNPISRWYGFSKQTLSSTCAKMNIEYVSLPNLGIQGEHRKRLDNKKTYVELFESYRTETLPKHTQTTKQLASNLSLGRRIALTCLEEDPSHCHRSTLANELLVQHNESCSRNTNSSLGTDIETSTILHV